MEFGTYVPLHLHQPHLRHFTRMEGIPLMLALLGVGLDVLGYVATIVIEGIRLADPVIRYG